MENRIVISSFHTRNKYRHFTHKTRHFTHTLPHFDTSFHPHALRHFTHTNPSAHIYPCALRKP